MKFIIFKQPMPLRNIVYPEEALYAETVCKDVTVLNEIVTRLSWHSDFVAPGDVFLLIPTLLDENYECDIKNFNQAYQRGARIFIVQHDFPVPSTDRIVQIVMANNVRALRATMARRIYPGQPDHVVAVTGTNGKTSTVQFCHQLWQLLGHQSASLGTLGLQCDKELDLDSSDFTLTSVDPFVLHHALSAMREKGITHLALEASSHGLDQYRLDALNFTAAGFTNLNQDHLDYHHTMADYFKAKLRLFDTLLQPGCTAVLNADIPEYNQLSQVAQNRHLHVLSYGMNPADLNIQHVDRKADHQVIKLAYQDQIYTIRFNFFSQFQVMNALCAVGLIISCGGIDPHQVIPLLGHLKTIPGRLELVATTLNQATVFIDYAHKPEALREVLSALRHHVTGRLIVVFGCGGDRDKTKRPMMGKIASDYADVRIITDDNPRFENPQLIRDSIMAQVTDGIDIADRGAAIKMALDQAVAGDVILIAGKGHEEYQIIQNQKIDFSDRQHIIDYINKNGGYLAQ